MKWFQMETKLLKLKLFKKTTHKLKHFVKKYGLKATQWKKTK